MFPRFATIILVALFLVTGMSETVGAQGRGRGSHGGAGVRVPPAPNAPVAPPQRPAFVGRVPGPMVGPRIVGGPRVTVVRPQRGIFGPQAFIGAYSPYIWTPSIYTAPLYATPSAYAGTTYAAPSVSENEAELAYQVQRLSQEVEQLRQEQALATVRQLPPPPQTFTRPRESEPERPVTPTVLVFRDGHRLLIQNYAMVGQTLWVLDEKTSTKISLSELDLDATQKENSGLGVRFRLPEK